MVVASVATAQTEAADSTATDGASLDSIYQNLPEVVVSGTQPIATLREGRLTYNMQLLQEKLPATSAFDALSNIPGMVADGDDNVKFASRPITLVLNGKPTSMTQQQVVTLLKSMPAERLAKAELMMAAPPSLHVRGVALNIVTTKQGGTSGQVQAGAVFSKYMKGIASANVIHQSGRWTVDANYECRVGKAYQEVDHSVNHLLGDTRVPYNEDIEGVDKAIYNNVRLGLDYQFGDNHSMSLAYTGDFTDYEQDNKSTGTYLSRQFRDGTNTMHNVDWNYQLPFGLQLNASYTYYKAPSDQSLTVTSAADDLSKTSSSQQTINVWQVSADQSHQLGKQWTLNYGVQGRFSRNESGQQTYTTDGQPITDGTSSIEINERIVDLYAGIDYNPSQKLSLSANVEGEHYHTPLFSEWRIYPSFSATWMPSQSHTLSLALSSNADYPTYWDIMSSVNYSSAYIEVWGNPQLKPANQYELSLTWQFCQRYTVTAFADLRNNEIQQQPYQPNDRLAVIMKRINFDHRNSYGLQLSAQLKAGSWFAGNAFGVVMLKNDKASDFFDVPFDRWQTSAIVGGNLSFVPSKKAGITLTVRPFFQSEAMQGVYDIRPIFKFASSIQWRSANRNWIARLDIKNPFNRRITTADNYRGQDYKMELLNDYRQATLTLTYKFGNYKQRQHKEVDTLRMGH